MSDIEQVWQRPDVARGFLDERSVLLPHREEQMQIMLRVIAAGLRGPARRVLDVGCGSGILLAAVIAAYPSASGWGVDYSPTMLEQAGASLAPFGRRAALEAADLRTSAWLRAVDGTFDIIVSGFCIHHLPDERKQSLYGEIFGLLAPGGAFVHAEHVASATPAAEDLFNDAMTEHLYRRRCERGDAVDLETVRREFMERPDRAANILAPVETQLGWLRQLGFVDVDCYWKWFELAIFGGRKPEMASIATCGSSGT